MRHIRLKTGSNTGGQPSRDERMAKIAELIELGVPVAKACRQQGVPRPTYYRLINKTADGEGVAQ